MNNICIFDLDGTLARTESYWIPVLDKIYGWIESEFDLKPSIENPNEALKLLGKPDEEIYRILFPGQETETINKIISGGRRIWKKMEGDFPYELFPGTLETLQYLNENKWRLFVSSNCDTDYLNSVLDQTGIRKYFEGTVCAENYPGLEKWEFTKKMLEGVQWEKGFFIGDSQHDMMAGRKNGLITVWASYGYALKPDESLIDQTINDITGLKESEFLL